ncbi:hypothetical protein OH76DRAFT_1489898 [Lentinus brumalis]|uniref:Uncharacterized protein n=1 Tax=Lentinus brumalis TaxID=2498619 RepID=A0A371CKW6_9APHY|nr:hypothetical protein OH76DRAFT_1489898 [Polyporus brumalis]
MSSIKTEDQIPALEAQALHSFVAEKTEDLHGEQGTTRQERLATMAEAVQVPVAESVEVKEEGNMDALQIAAQTDLALHQPAAAGMGPFSPEPRIFYLRLPKKLDAERLPRNYKDTLSRIRGTDCKWCNDTGRDCVQASSFKATWKCAACYRANRSGCTWQVLSKERGLGTQPPCTSRISRQFIGPNVRG